MICDLDETTAISDHVEETFPTKTRRSKAYQLNPGAAIGGYLGVQSGSYGGESQSAWAQWYHQYNDLGTVQATTDASGLKIALSEPDFYGNYRLVSGTRPDSIGLTSKFFDADAGLYYFNARWYDPERGRWMSKDPIGYEGGVNLYLFTNGSPILLVDPSGLAWDWPYGTTVKCTNKQKQMCNIWCLSRGWGKSLDCDYIVLDIYVPIPGCGRVKVTNRYYDCYCRFRPIASAPPPSPGVPPWNPPTA